MNKAEFYAAVAEKAQVSKKDAAAILDAAIEVLCEKLKAKESIQMVGIGAIGVKEVAERNAIDPRTKEPVVVPAHNRVVFTAGRKLKDAANGKAGE